MKESESWVQRVWVDKLDQSTFFVLAYIDMLEFGDLYSWYLNASRWRN